MRRNLLCSTLFLLSVTCRLQAQTITTFAGGGASLNDNAPAVDAGLGQPVGIAIDREGNMYIGDYTNNRIRKIDPSGIITTIAGTGQQGYSGNGHPATAATLNGPHGVAVDDSGNVYFADTYNNCIRKINKAGIISTYAGDDTLGFRGDGGMAAADSAELNEPMGVALDPFGDLLIADQGNNRIRVVGGGNIYTVAGTGTEGHTGDGGPAAEAQLNHPYAVMLDAGDNLYIGEQRGGCVRKIDIVNRVISTIVGSDSAGFGGDNGPATAAMLEEAEGLAMDAEGNLYISDTYNNRVRKVTRKGIITTYAGTDSAGFSGDGMAAASAQLFFPVGLAIDTADNLYIADQGNNRIRRITPDIETVPTINNTQNNLVIYPNPSDGSFTFTLSSNTDKEVTLTITNITGEQIKQCAATANQPMTIKLDAPPGMYFLTAVTEKSMQSAIIQLR